MNKTRKELINILEKYMDKTLSFGCYVTIPGYKREEGICQIADNNKGEYGLYAFIGGKSNELYPLNDIKPNKILGHYDITAVLKCIDNIGGSTHNECIDRDVIIVYKNHGQEDEIVGEIPLKPLCLYTEQEEKDLLDLLKKLCKN